MTTRMLIDARHREETRVAVVNQNRIEEFDFESAERKQLKGNIYLAKVTRVEPSLQAAFVDYGGNRHGFLAFSEIHPDYYQIPKEDREALLREEAEHAAAEAALRAEQDEDEHDDADDAGDEAEAVDHDEEEDASGDEEQAESDDAPPRPRRGNDEEVEALRQRRMNLRRRYKIQDVIRRRQVLLVQVVKEERGNKGAALTTYLSLAGRYCVLMPNTSHGGGISRKINNAADRKRLKSIMAEMKLPPSMGCIVRTAGLQRTRTEIKRDFDYLARLWDGIREETLKSAAPALIYGDSDLIKRAIRDIYNAGVDEVIVEGEEGFRHAKDFMRLLMPSHARRVKQYADAVPLFQRAGVEDQLAAMYNPVVQLKSGGYLVINPTEALVSIDINSGRSTREHNIEQTATATNLEAAGEIARQLRLRDMAGLIVIDFIDMDNGSNVRKVEKAMKEALKDDRARIQVGRISSFGLLEMSRQRLRTGVLEASSRTCPHCEGTGLVRTAASAGLSALRLIEDEAARGRGSCITLRASQEAAVYVLNRKRADVAEIEDRYGVQVEILPDREEEGARMLVEASGPPPAYAPRIEPLVIVDDEDEPEEVEAEDFEEEIEAEVEVDAPGRRDEGRREERGGDEGGGRKRRRRRGRRNRGRGEEGSEQVDTAEGVAEEAEGDEGGEPELEFAGEAPQENGELSRDEAARDEADGGRRRRGRRGRRGGRRGDVEQAEAITDPQMPLDTPGDAEDEPDTAEADAEPETIEAGDAGHVVSPLDIPTPEEDAKPKRRRRSRAPTADAAEATTTEAPAETPEFAGEAPAKPRRSRRKAVATEAQAVIEPQADVGEPQTEPEQVDKPKRRSRRKTASTDEGVGTETPSASEYGPAETSGGTPEPELPVVAAEAPSAPPQAANDPADATLATRQDGTLPSDAAPAEREAPAEPPRRGWWQRTFGG